MLEKEMMTFKPPQSSNSIRALSNSLAVALASLIKQRNLIEVF